MIVVKNHGLKYLWPLCAAVCLLLACKGGGEAQEEVSEDLASDSAEVADTDTLVLLPPKEVPVAADQNFADFFYSFVTDPSFQQSRMKLPLPCVNAQGDAISRQQWEEEQRFASQEIYCVLYDRDQDVEIEKDTSLRQVNVSWVDLHEGRYQTFHFHRRHVQWRLEDYSEGALSQSREASFLQFYTHFAADTLTQHQTVELPLKVVVEPEDGSDHIVTELSESEWQEFRSELPLPTQVMTLIDYGQPSLSENRKILMLEGLSSGYFMIFKFDRTNDRWRLYQVES